MTAQPPSRPAATPAGSGRPGDDDGAWHRRVWQLAGPIILANLTTPLLGAVDTAVVGHLPDPSFIGGVAVGGVVFSFLFWGFGFLRMGTTGFTAQAYGAGDAAELSACQLRPLALAVGFGCLGIQSEEHTSELQSLMRISYAVFCLKKKKKKLT